MKLKSLRVKNFRNFENVTIDLTNQNVVFGMNDVGKTNFLFAIRFLLDRDIRKNGFIESDYLKNDTNEIIEITLGIDLSDRESSEDSQHILAKVGKARSSNDLDNFFFQVKGVYDEGEEVGIPKIYWGSAKDNLEEIPQNGIYSDLDNLFKIVYIDPTIDLEKTFSKNRKKLFDQNKLETSDIVISNDIKKLGLDMNRKISSMGVIQSFQETITEEYQKLKKEKINIEMKSEITINGYFGNLVPYIKRENDDNVYPTSGDGRKKILAYSLINHLMKAQEGNKIIIYLVEEPENSLHRSMQIALSQQLFNSEVYKYFFLSTHSSELLYEMDNASLIRIYSEKRINCSSYIYNVDDEYKNVKKELNRALSTALFSEKVLLIEGPSEKVLFEKVLEKVFPRYELEGGYILEVNGIKFKPYVDVLKGLNITSIVKTDNDLKAKRGHPTKFDLIGINRCLNLIHTKGEQTKEHVEIDYYYENEKGNRVFKERVKQQMIKEKKREQYDVFEKSIKQFEENNIFLSRIDLEHDLYEVIEARMKEILGTKPIDYLQNHKLINMIELASKLTIEDCEAIIEHPLFQSLSKLVPNEID
ncbi:ATP-dependent nuclease [Paraliobacillus zengyii]|uniref:ATP-dependent nuclease n=1 Tax=Paraliobacillus zengyii TaxID=2213194 RepID=UPI000DD2F9AD|nr:AAA family ATPase [Paraliobacillus zengyii]